MGERFSGPRWFPFYGSGLPEVVIITDEPSNKDNQNTPETQQTPIVKREKKEKRNLTTFLNSIWHYIKYRFVESYKKETDEKTLQILQSEQFILEFNNFLIKLDELEKTFLADDFAPNLLEFDKDRAIFIEEVNTRISKFNEENSFGISLSDFKDHWEESKVLRIIAYYKEYMFLIDYTEDSGFEARHIYHL